MGALSFNPYEALAEIQKRQGPAAKPANPAKDSPKEAKALAALAGLAGAPVETANPCPPVLATESAANWSAALARLDASRAPRGIDPCHWRTLLADAQWLCDRHGRAAHRLGWDASALFGIGPRIGWGGLADRLEGARNLVLTDRVAHWRGADLEGWLWRESMRPMPLIWSIANLDIC